ncbi:MAG: EAL domain-containing protein, partial [Ramlibacter sp.]|nr:EAL domain-containing protein [Ramlibacter sp.]
AADRDTMALAGATIAMARALGLRTVATGIDQASQLAGLEAQQCDEYQGPLVGPPMKASAFARRWLTTQSDPSSQS